MANCVEKEVVFAVFLAVLVGVVVSDDGMAPRQIFTYNCGKTAQDSVVAEFDSTTDTLTIKGKGEMADFDNYTGIEGDPRPWANHNKIDIVLFEDGVKSIGNFAFADLNSLLKVRVSKTVVTIGEAAFKQCMQLSVLDFSKGSQLNEIMKGSFKGTAIKQLEIPDSVTVIGDDAFKSCSMLSCVTLGDDCKDIGNGAFAFCGQLFTFVFQGGNKPSCKENAFEADELLEKAYVPKNYYGDNVCGIPIEKTDNVNSVRCSSKQQELEERVSYVEELTKALDGFATALGGLVSVVFAIVLAIKGIKGGDGNAAGGNAAGGEMGAELDEHS